MPDETEKAGSPADPQALPAADPIAGPDGAPVETTRHRNQMILLIRSLRDHWSHRHDFYVSGDMFLYFSPDQDKDHDCRGVDVFVVLGTTDRERTSWVAWEESGRLPDLVIDLTSPSTARSNHGAKKRTYERVLRVPEYFLFDPRNAEFEGFALVEDSYRDLAPDPSGRLFSAKLGLQLGPWAGTYAGVEATWLRWFTADGDLIPTPVERARGDVERALCARNDVEQRVRSLEAQVQEHRSLEAQVAEHDRRQGRRGKRGNRR